MANFIGAIERFNPYIQQIPTEAYTKVGMYKEQQYQAGVQKVQETVDNIAGLDIANEGGRQYLRNRVGELTKSLNKYSQKVDFSNPNNVTQLVGLARPLFQDENIVNDVINTGVYRRWQKLANEKMEKGDMDSVQYYYEQQEAAPWLNSDTAGARYTGRQTPNDSTQDKINKKVMDFKSKLKPDTRYAEGDVFLYGSKSYNVSQLSELIYNQVLDANDREMLMHNNMFEDTLRYNMDPNSPKNDLIGIYTGKKTNNELQLKKVNLQLEQFKDKNDPDYQSLMRDKEILESNIKIYDQTIATFSKTDPKNESHKKAIYTNIAAENYKNSLAGIFEFEQLKPEYREDVKQSRDHKNAVVTSAISKGTIAYTQLKDENGEPMWDAQGNPVMGIRAVVDENGDPTILEKESDLITTVDANGNVISTQRKSGSGSTKKQNPLVTLLTGTPGEAATVEVAGEDDIVRIDKEILSNEYFALDGSIQQNILSMSKVFEAMSSSGTFKVSDYYRKEQMVGPDGKDRSVLIWTSPEKKKEFLQYMDMMNSAYEIEAADGNQANKSFRRFIEGELDITSKELGLEGVDKKAVDELMKLKGNNAILSMMDEVFKNKDVIKNLEAIDAAVVQKTKLANSWRKVLFNNAKNDNDRKVINKLTDEDLMRLNTPAERTVANTFQIDKAMAEKMEDDPITIKYTDNGDGTYTGTAYLGFGGNGKPIPSAVIGRSIPKKIVDSKKDTNEKLRKQYSKYVGGLGPNDEIVVSSKSGRDLVFETGRVWKNYAGEETNPFGLSVEAIADANKQLKNQYSVIRQNIARSVSLLNLPENKQEKDAIMQAITSSIMNAGGSMILSDPNFFQSDNDDIDKITGIEDIVGASAKAVGSFFNNSGFLNIKFKYQDKEGKEKSGLASYNIDRILTNDPQFASKYSKYFAGLKYAKEGAAIRVESYINPTKGHKSYSGEGTGNLVSPSGVVYQDNAGALGRDFTRHTIQTSDGHKVPINYKVISYGDAEEMLPDAKVDANKYAIQFQVNTPSGKKNIFMKNLNGDIIQYSTPEEALYQLKDVLFKDLPVDHKGDLVKTSDGRMVPNYFTEINGQKPSLRGFFNTMLKLNDISLPTAEEIKKAYADLKAGNASDIDKELLKFSPIIN